MDMNEFYIKFRQAFERAMQEKTGWGRNEVMIKFDQAFISVIAPKVEVSRNGLSDSRRG